MVILIVNVIESLYFDNVEQHITDATNETNYVIKPGSEITNPRVCRNCKDDESYPKLRNDLDLTYAQRYSGK